VNDQQAWVLVVEDDDDIREMVAITLELHGHHVFTAPDGLAALDVIREHGRPAGVLLDLRMPRMSGAEFAHILRRDPALAGIPIVVLSGDTHAFETGEAPDAAAYIKKPTDASQLLEVVDKWFVEHPAAAAGVSARERQ
jgi:CheY-like chemotaxis protein